MSVRRTALQTQVAHDFELISVTKDVFEKESEEAVGVNFHAKHNVKHHACKMQSARSIIQKDLHKTNNNSATQQHHKQANDPFNTITIYIDKSSNWQSKQ